VLRGRGFLVGPIILPQ